MKNKNLKSNNITHLVKWKTLLTTLGILITLLITVPIHAESFTLTSTNCASSIYNMTVINLQPGWYHYYNITILGPVSLQIYANITSNVPVEIAVYTPSGESVWESGASTEFIGTTYTVTLNTPGTYQIAVYNPRSNEQSANITGWFYVTMCGSVDFRSWLSQFTQLWSTPLGYDMAPMGIVAYGVMDVDGQYFGYNLTTNAVKGVVYIPSDVSAKDYYENGTYYGDAFSVQLNAYVVVQLADGNTQYYWIQDVVQLYNGYLRILNNIWNETTYISYFKLKQCSWQW
jgi:hypothetical protein